MGKEVLSKQTQQLINPTKKRRLMKSLVNTKNVYRFIDFRNEARHLKCGEKAGYQSHYKKQANRCARHELKQLIRNWEETGY